jgi:hypothetical protein
MEAVKLSETVELEVVRTGELRTVAAKIGSGCRGNNGDDGEMKRLLQRVSD